MRYQDVRDNWQALAQLLEQMSTADNKHLGFLFKQYIEQNILILNDIITTSITNLKILPQAETANDIICMQARLTNEISKKLTLSTQRFLNASLGHIADYNEWVKAHCDLATD